MHTPETSETSPPLVAGRSRLARAVQVSVPELARLRAENAALRRQLAQQGSSEDVLGSRDGWRVLLETLPQIVWITSPDGWHVHFNGPWSEFTGLSPEESLGSGWSAFHPDDRERAAARWSQALATGEPYEVEYRLRRHDGVHRWMLGRASPLRDADGHIVRWFGTCTDIDDLKRTQSVLEEQRELLRLAGEVARLGGWTLDLASRELTWSQEIAAISGFPADATPDLAGSLELYAPEHRDALRSAIGRCALDGTPFDLRLQVRDAAGGPRWVRVIGGPRFGDDGSIVQVAGAVQDVTAAHEERRRSEDLADLLSTTLESMTDGFAILDRQARFTYVNRQAEAALGRPRAQLLGVAALAVVPDARGTPVEYAVRRALRDGVPVSEELQDPERGVWWQVNVAPTGRGVVLLFRDISRQRRDQRALEERVKELDALATINGAAHGLTDPDELCDLTARSVRDAMQDPDRTLVEVQLATATSVTASGAQGPPTLATPIVVDGVPRGRIALWTEGGTPLVEEEMGVVRTVAETLGLWSARQQASVDLQEAHDALEDANRRLAGANLQLGEAAQLKDDLLSMASHELRTPLTPILGFLELLDQRGDNLTAPQHRMVHVMRNNARRMLRLVDDLLVVSRAAADALVPRPTPVRLAGAFAPVLDELADSLPAVELDVGDELAHVDPQHLAQILVNLCTNAAKYGAPPVTIRSRPDGQGGAVLEVSDRGPGVDPAFRDRMWDRFEQKDRGNTRTATGAGLGLAIVRLLAEVNGGRVGYRDGAPGAVFTVQLPGVPPG